MHAPAGTSGFHHDHRLVARGGARGRHELARRVDRFDVQQHGTGVGVAGEHVKQIAEVHIDVLAQRYQLRKPDAPRACPIEHRGDERARLRDEGDVAGDRIGVGKGGVQAQPRRHQADAVGAEQPQQVRPGCRQGLGLLCGGEAGRHHDGRAGADGAEFGDQPRHRLGWCAQHREIGHRRQIGGSRIDAFAAERGVLRIHRIQRTLERARTQVSPHRAAHPAGAGGCAEHRHGAGFQQTLQVSDAQVNSRAVRPVPPRLPPHVRRPVIKPVSSRSGPAAYASGSRPGAPRYALVRAAWHLRRKAGLRMPGRRG
jgi:hypothetical protein